MIKHHYQQLIDIFEQCFGEEYNTKLVKGDDEPVYLPADEQTPYHRIVFAHGFSPAHCMKFRIGALRERQDASKSIMATGIAPMVVMKNAMCI